VPPQGVLPHESSAILRDVASRVKQRQVPTETTPPGRRCAFIGTLTDRQRRLSVVHVESCKGPMQLDIAHSAVPVSLREILKQG
jgi:hypothetical protein